MQPEAGRPIFTLEFLWRFTERDLELFGAERVSLEPPPPDREPSDAS